MAEKLEEELATLVPPAAHHGLRAVPNRTSREAP